VPGCSYAFEASQDTPGPPHHGHVAVFRHWSNSHTAWDRAFWIAEVLLSTHLTYWNDELSGDSPTMRRVHPEDNPSFIADDQLGKLARWMRILGLDTLYFKEIDDSELIRRAVEEDRILLTRDTRIAAEPGSATCIFVESDNWIEQLKQIISQLKLKVAQDRLFSRCLLCNSPLEPIPKADVKDRVPPFVFQTQEEFVRCPSCDKIYWQGTHVSHVLDKLKPLL